MRFTLFFCFLVVISVMASCKKTRNKDSDKLISIKDGENYIAQKGYIVFKTPDTTITFNTPEDTITFSKGSDLFSIEGTRGPLYSRLEIGITCKAPRNSSLPLKIYVDSVYKVYTFGLLDEAVGSNLGLWNNNPLNLKITFTQYDKPPVLAKGTFTGIVQRVYYEGKDKHTINELAQGEFYLEF